MFLSCEGARQQRIIVVQSRVETFETIRRQQPGSERRAVERLESAAGHLYPTGSRYMCPYYATEDSDYDVFCWLRRGVLETLREWSFNEDHPPSGPAGEDFQSVRCGRVNAVVFYDTGRYHDFEAFRAATVWGRTFGAPSSKEDRKALFQRAERECWKLTTSLRCV